MATWTRCPFACSAHSGVHKKEETEKRTKVSEEVRATWERKAGRSPVALDSTATVDQEAAHIRTVMEEILNLHAKKWRACTRSKVWWDREIATLRKAWGKPTRERRLNPAAYTEAQTTLRRAIRRAKKTCWESFVQGAEKKDLWRAVKYTAPKLEDKVQVLVDEAGNKATSWEERECMLIESAFPRAPDTGEQAALPDGGRAHQCINTALVGRLLAKTRNTSAPGGDRMGAEIIKVLWEWAPERITALVKECIQLGHHPESWKVAKGVVIPKPGKPDYNSFAPIGSYPYSTASASWSNGLPRT